MDVDDGKGSKTEAVSAVLLPSIFRAKVEHSTYKTWKALSESKNEDWESIQVSFSRVAEKQYGIRTNDPGGRFHNNNQRYKKSTLSEKDKKYLIRRLKKVHWSLGGSTRNFCGMIEKN